MSTETREVEEGKAVAVANVEEKVVGASVIAVLKNIGQGKFEQTLVELHRLLNIGTE